MSNQYILCVDPGGYTMGACLFDRHDFFDDDCIAIPVAAMSIEIDDKERRNYEANTIIQKLIASLEVWFDKRNITFCYCEKPRTFASATSWAATVQGHLQLLDTFRGALLQLCSKHGCDYSDVGVTQWKGNLPKKIVIDRVKKLIGKGGCMELSKAGHDWDAVGIGLYVQGVF